MQAAETIVDYKLLYEELEVKYTLLLHEIEKIKKLVFSSKHERFVATDPNLPSTQLSLALDAETIAQCKLTGAEKIEYIRTKTEVTVNKPKVHPGRVELPANLRRETTILQPDADISGLKKIGDEVTEILEYTPGELYVKQYIRPKYIQPINEISNTVITASLPGRIMEKCKAGEGLVAQILVDKYMDHIPLHRQLQRYLRAGVSMVQSTINGWVAGALFALTGLFELHEKTTLRTGYLNVDETTIKVLDEMKKGTTHLGYYWVYLNSQEKLVLFDYQKGRGREGPNEILKDFKGYLQTDGYSVYEEFDKKPGITLLHCMAHARRKFNDALQNDKARAEHALILFQQLYAIERTIKEKVLTGEDLLQLRKEQAVPVLEELEKWMTTEYPKVTPKSPIGKAIAYCLPRWKKLSIYTTNAMLNIDNNPVENAIRPIAIGRKNYMFAGSHDAAQRAAMIYSLFATCRLHGINPYDWLKYVLQNIHLCTTQEKLAQLLPQNWKKPAA
jgi:transposase